MNAIVSYRVLYLGNAIQMTLYLLKLGNMITVYSLIQWRVGLICTIITLPRIVFPVELRRWDGIKPTSIQLRVFFRSASSGLIKI